MTHDSMEVHGQFWAEKAISCNLKITKTNPHFILSFCLQLKKYESEITYNKAEIL